MLNKDYIGSLATTGIAEAMPIRNLASPGLAHFGQGRLCARIGSSNPAHNFFIDLKDALCTFFPGKAGSLFIAALLKLVPQSLVNQNSVHCPHDLEDILRI